MNIENETDKKKRQQKYGEYVRQVTPSFSLPRNMFRAFLTGAPSA